MNQMHTNMLIDAVANQLAKQDALGLQKILSKQLNESAITTLK